MSQSRDMLLRVLERSYDRQFQERLEISKGIPTYLTVITALAAGYYTLSHLAEWNFMQIGPAFFYQEAPMILGMVFFLLSVFYTVRLLTGYRIHAMPSSMELFNQFEERRVDLLKEAEGYDEQAGVDGYMAEQLAANYAYALAYGHEVELSSNLKRLRLKRFCIVSILVSAALLVYLYIGTFLGGF